jgi:hypothetical protein
MDKMSLYSASTEEQMKVAFEALGYALNNFNYKEQAELFFGRLSREHRTLQQNFWRMMIKVIEKYADSEWYDARNEASVQMCRVLKTALENNYFLDLPTV